MNEYIKAVIADYARWLVMESGNFYGATIDDYFKSESFKAIKQPDENINSLMTFEDGVHEGRKIADKAWRSKMRELVEVTADLIAYSKIRPIEGVVYPNGTHQEVIDKADRLVYDMRMLIKDKSSQAKSDTKPELFPPIQKGSVADRLFTAELNRRMPTLDRTKKWIAKSNNAIRIGTVSFVMNWLKNELLNINP